MNEYIIYIDKITTSIVRVPAKNKKEAIAIAERFIDDSKDEQIEIDKIIKFNPEYKFKARLKSHKCPWSK